MAKEKTREWYRARINQLLEELYGAKYVVRYTESDLLKFYAHELPIVLRRVNRAMIARNEARIIREGELAHVTNEQLADVDVGFFDIDPNDQLAYGRWYAKVQEMNRILSTLLDPITEDDHDEYVRWLFSENMPAAQIKRW